MYHSAQSSRVAVSHQREVQRAQHLEHDHRQPEQGSQRLVIGPEPFHLRAAEVPRAVAAGNSARSAAQNQGRFGGTNPAARQMGRTMGA